MNIVIENELSLTPTPEITFTPKVAVKSCGIGSAPITGTLEIVYRPITKLLEFEAFEVWLASLSGETMTAEQLCKTVYSKIMVHVNPYQLSVVLRAESINHASVKVKYEKRT